MRKLSELEKTQFIKELDVYGYAVFENYLSDETVKILLDKVDKLYQAEKNYSGVPERDLYDKIIYNLQNKDKVFIDILSDDFVVDVCKTKLNDPYYRFLPDTEGNYILSYYNARSSGSKLDLHIDSYIPAAGDRTWAMQVVFVLEDMTINNGCTIVVPGSHKSNRYTDRELVKTKALEAKAGSLVIWDSRLWHGTEENTAKMSRWLLIATFTSWWIKQSMDIPRSLPDEIYKKLSPQQKAMLGFCSIPPKNENERINTKMGYDSLLDSVKGYKL